MRICSRAGARFCTAALARSCATSSQPPLRPNRSCWRITSPRRVMIEAAIEWWGKAGQRSHGTLGVGRSRRAAHARA